MHDLVGASQHPVLAALDAARSALKDVRDVQPTFMTTAQKKAALVEVVALEAQAVELKARLLASSGDVADEDGARDIGTWLSTAAHADLRASRAEAELAGSLDRSWTRVAAGMADGAVNPAQARVVVEALDALPPDLAHDKVAQAEDMLVGWCEEFRPHELRQLGRRILAYVDPDAADARDAKRLELEEASAREKMRLTLRGQGDGTTRISGLLPDAAARRLTTYLEAFASPRNPAGTPAGAGEADRIPYRRRLAHAFCSLMEHLDPRELPDHGGDATTVIVTIGLDDLVKDLGTASLLGGADAALGPHLSAGEARRLACTAQIIPAVLGSHGEVLDLGRADRLFRPAQRKAMRLRDKRCRVRGCAVPATWCEAHHLRPWSEGGLTNLDDGVLLCSWHHHRIHDPRYEHEIPPGGDIVIRRMRQSSA